MTPAPISSLGWRLLAVGMIRTLEGTYTLNLTLESLKMWLKQRK